LTGALTSLCRVSQLMLLDAYAVQYKTVFTEGPGPELSGQEDE